MSDNKNKYQNNLMKESDFFRIKYLFEKWWNWLAYLTLAYVFVYISWNISIRPSISSIGGRFKIIEDNPNSLSFPSILALLFVIIIRGLMFCADGLVTSWLKSPFSQICYSVNKSGIDHDKADKIITLMTEVNEHFKETFKKFGILTISTELMDFYLDEFHEILHSLTKKGLNSDNLRMLFTQRQFLKNVVNLSLIVPLIFASFRILKAKDLINEIEISKDEY